MTHLLTMSYQVDSLFKDKLVYVVNIIINAMWCLNVENFEWSEDEK